jgi:hypothetical protein
MSNKDTLMSKKSTWHFQNDFGSKPKSGRTKTLIEIANEAQASDKTVIFHSCEHPASVLRGRGLDVRVTIKEDPRGDEAVQIEAVDELKMKIILMSEER